MLEALKEQVYKANIDIVKHGLVILTWGNVSAIDRESSLVVIKPSGVSYDEMKAEDMVVVDLNTGKVVEGKYKPSSDTPTHLEIYRKYPTIMSIAHTHSVNAVAFAQAGMPIKALGTTHADCFNGDIPCTRDMKEAEVKENYEDNTGKVIIETIGNNDPLAIPGVLVKSHGPFVWGKDVNSCVIHAVIVEKVAEMNLKTLLLNKDTEMKKYILEKHYTRKHGPNAYYGQGKK